MKQLGQRGHRNLLRRATVSWPKSLNAQANHLRRAKYFAATTGNIGAKLPEKWRNGGASSFCR
jgi:hypothetical protein